MYKRQVELLLNILPEVAKEKNLLYTAVQLSIFLYEICLDYQ